jgi:hypothetical protein
MMPADHGGLRVILNWVGVKPQVISRRRRAPSDGPAAASRRAGRVHPVPRRYPALRELAMIHPLGNVDLGPCATDPNPQVNVVCGDGDRGWCVAGACRPMAYASGSSCPICPAGTLRYTTGEAAYCAPGVR